MLLLVATTAIAVVVTYPRLIREEDDDAAKNSAQTYVDREVAGGNGLVAEQGASTQRARSSRPTRRITSRSQPTTRVETS